MESLSQWPGSVRILGTKLRSIRMWGISIMLTGGLWILFHVLERLELKEKLSR